VNCIFTNPKIPEAIAQFQQELALNPGHAASYYKLADAYSRIQKFDDAERLAAAFDLAGCDGDGAVCAHGKSAAKKGEPALAVRSLQRAIAMDPNNAISHHLLGQGIPRPGPHGRCGTRTKNCGANASEGRRKTMSSPFTVVGLGELCGICFLKGNSWAALPRILRT